ncbi:uncharacterized protein PFL1_03149 [Pseudozyma flocculosa PF-1]|uniref:Related to MDR1 - Mac1p interacting protein n=2 Tax=Pseudozyma flocculosa TaxID=84751 RepID=A0A5C3F1M2_9BASI|nr:uncharacterized protein PFL1_03149 [Pseudozyma flocculosa PF-1]EPQ29394.1 hypothetical protein PFL1_03149 [Pseudozyma flocculosa PF-1]SPO37915.1 related to MDR1 - Mac1p interacting protein [Pseudozyma flocculosa]
MDAHTLNAWTRFALQKGGIGSCTALIDNPATEPEDLMFMTGEKIIVLRRLDEDGADTNDRPTSLGARRKSSASSSAHDSASWFLGYCEGVVGRFKGAHVQFHGRLKKPVLMRRSGVGSVPDTSSPVHSKDEELALPTASQTYGSDAAAATSYDGHVDSSDRLASASSSSSKYARAGGSSPMRGGGDRDGPSPSSRVRSPDGLHVATKAGGGGYAGVTTPPISDEGHQLKMKSLQAALVEDDDHDDAASDDSDDSVSLLPWARQSQEVGSSSRPRAGSSRQQQPGKAHGYGDGGLSGGGGASHLPPSPISSSESPITRTSHEGAAAVSTTASAKASRRSSQEDTSRASSTYTTSATDDSDDEGPNRRRDYTFSIYDVYGRDSVAFPNFDFREAYANGGGGGGAGAANRKRMSRLAASKSSESLAAQASTEPLPPSPHLAGHKVPGRHDGGPLPGSPSLAPLTARPGQGDIPAALRSPSGRRPNAAPDPRLPPLPSPGMGPPNLASSLRRQVEASSSPTSPPTSYIEPGRGPSPRSPPLGQHNGVAAAPSGAAAARLGPVSFDPRRRPSAGNISAPSMVSTSPVTPVDPSQPAFFPPSHQTASPTSPASELSSASLRRPGFAESLGRRRSQSMSKMQISLTDVGPAMRSNEAAGFAAYGERDLGSPGAGRLRHGAAGSPGLGPMRASSDRLSERERIHSGSGSGMLRKNPSNPTPGLHGGSGLHGLSPMARSGSPMSSRSGPSPVNSIDMARRGSDARSVATASRSPARSPLSEDLRTPTHATHGSGPISFDPMGFVFQGGPPAPPQVDDPETRDRWLALFKEDDVAAAKKSRKVKKLVRQGIPPSIRGQAWLFLANASVRRRAGLFEQLCKTSLAPKGKKGKEALYDAIDKDLDRSFPDHRLFMGESATGKADLEAILKSYVHFNPVIGYTQGMGLLAGLAMIHMAPEDAFWLVCAALRDPHMEGYYTPAMKQLHVDSVVLSNLLSTMDPELSQRFAAHGIEPIMFTPSWFLPLFTRIVPWPTLIRIWDIFFFEGPTWLLRVALAVIRIIREPLMRTPGHGEMLQMLLHPPHAHLTPENILNCAFSVKLKDGEMRKLSRQASKLVRESNGARGRAPTRQDTAGSRSTSAPARR